MIQGILEIDNRGKVRLSMRLVDQQTGEDLSGTKEVRSRPEPRGDRPDRGDRERRPRREREAS
jgi:polyribonucleotide nucleotidyltransferase